jgi:hypothetical protein
LAKRGGADDNAPVEYVFREGKRQHGYWAGPLQKGDFKDLQGIHAPDVFKQRLQAA